MNITLFEVVASLRLTGTFDPEEITAALCRVPTDQWRAGQAGPAPKLRRSSDGWVLESAAGAGHVGEQVDRALDELAPISDRLRHILSAREMSGCLSVAVDTDGQGRPVIALSAAALRLLAASGLSLDVDVISGATDDPDPATPVIRTESTGHPDGPFHRTVVSWCAEDAVSAFLDEWPDRSMTSQDRPGGEILVQAEMSVGSFPSMYFHPHLLARLASTAMSLRIETCPRTT
ncbi:DUF4279 domain-containing protein [Nocardia sp. JW2]|uniref:DUF4279 domain-containing protein n=1 Tax=Nocardia sp. JW2 TaxID=3450738 RepID=UPI003F4381AE